MNRNAWLEVRDSERYFRGWCELSLYFSGMGRGGVGIAEIAAIAEIGNPGRNGC